MKRMLFMAALALASCNRSERPEAPTQAETERLNDAEEMLNELANEEGAAPEDTAPTLNSK